MPSQCSIPDCDKPTVGRGWCRRHYRRWYQRKGDGGDPAQLRSNHHLGTPWRFWMKVNFTDTCWLWNAHLDREGYGGFSVGGMSVPAHRWAYEFCVGPIPDGLTIDHLCRVHNCQNPDHLEPVTRRENVRRGARYSGSPFYKRWSKVLAL